MTRCPVRVLSLAVLLALAGCAPKGEALYQRASDSLAKGDASAALIDLKNLVQAEPDNARARALLAQALLATGDVTAGELEIQKAKELGAPMDLVRVSSCRVLIARARFEQALAECKPEKGTPAQQIDLQVGTGNALLGLNRAAEAKPVFEAALASNPNSLEATLGYAGAVQIVDGAEPAKAVLAKAPAAVKEQPRYWLALAGLSAVTNAYADAEAAFKTAVEKTEKNPESLERVMALGGLAEMQMRQGNVAAADETSARLIKIAPKHPLAMLLRGQVAAAGGKLDEARSLLEEVVSSQPDNADARMLLAIVNMQQGNIDQAEQHLKAVVGNNPQNARAQQMLAEIRARQGLPDTTLAGVKSALQQSPGDPTMLAMAGRLSLASGDRDQALVYLAEASKAGADASPEAQLNIANGYLLAGETDRALEVLQAMPETGATASMRDSMLLATLLRKGDDAQLMAQSKAILARSGKDPVTRNLVGSVYAAAGKKDLAREQFREALKLAPGDTAALMNLAKLDFSEGNPAAAESNLVQILGKEPKNLQATLGMAAAAGARKDAKAVEKYLVQAATEHPDSIEAQVALAQFYLSTNNAQKAKTVADAAAAANPQSAPMANARGVIMMGAKDLAAGIASFEQALRLDPKSLEYATNLARAKIMNRDTQGALNTLDTVLRSDPKSVPALALAAATSLQSGNQERAVGYVERLRQAAPDSPVTYQMEGDLAMSQKRYREALAFYEKADPRAQNRNIVIARYSAAQYSQAPQPERILEQWVTKNPADAEVIGMLGESRRAKGDLDGAIRLYEQGLQKSPDSAVLLNNLAMVYVEKGDARGLPTAAKAYNLLPKVPAIQDTYGWALLKAGKMDKAVEILTEAARGMPDNAEVQYHLAVALASAGRKSEALPVLKKAIGGALPPATRAEATKLLGQLQ